MKEAMSQEEFDARTTAGEDPYAVVADDLRRQGYVARGNTYVSPVTPEELAERGFEGSSRCRCDTAEGYVACPPQMCDAQALVDQLLAVQQVSHSFRMSFGGIPMAQYLVDLGLWETVLNSNPNLTAIVELGTWEGGMSVYLYAQTQVRNLGFLTFDMIKPERTIPGFERKDIYRYADELGQRFGEMGPIALFCDGGNKPRELRTYAPLLAPGSIILVHDWGTEMLPEDVPDFLEMIYGDHCERIGSVTRVFKMKE